MLCREVIKIIEETYPAAAALEWDNVGLLAGRQEKEVKSVYVALDATDEGVDAAIAGGADLLVTHHPLIFGGLKRVTDGDFIGKRIVKLLQNDISYYAMHTNYDVGRMAELSCEKLNLKNAQVLEVTQVSENGTEEGIGKIADVPPVKLKELCGRVKKAFDLDTVKIFGDPAKEVRRIAICPGSGKSVIGEALAKGADVLVTGDIGHHEGIDAVAQGLAVIDAGHYGIEHIFIRDMKEYLEQHIAGIRVQAAAISHPFLVL